jgi:hypothetical protein
MNLWLGRLHLTRLRDYATLNASRFQSADQSSSRDCEKGAARIIELFQAKPPACPSAAYAKIMTEGLNSICKAAGTFASIGASLRSAYKFLEVPRFFPSTAGRAVSQFRPP